MERILALEYDGEVHRIVVHEEDVLHFPDGLVGFPDWQEFAFLAPEGEPAAMLVCLNQPAIAFLVTDPRLIVAEYRPPLGLVDRARLGLGLDEEPQCLTLLTVRADGAITANLLGPLVINPRTRIGCQLVLDDGRYSSRQPVCLPMDGACSS
jgi:flagellar assembly factor FliW